MPRSESKDYLSVESYRLAQGALHSVSGITLFDFCRDSTKSKRNSIIRNLIARGDMMVTSVFRLWEIQDYQDCWIIHRCLLERLFHVFHLNQTNTFETFEEWSFLEQYNAFNRIRSDPEFGQALEAKMFGITEEKTERARVLGLNPPVWQRPKAEEVAKQLDMRFLYRFAYDLASTHVHPMANDGDQDFYTITRIEPSLPGFPDQRAVLFNSLLVGTMLVQEGLNACTFKWQSVVYDCLTGIRGFLKEGEAKQLQPVMKLGAMVEGGMKLSTAE